MPWTPSGEAVAQLTHILQGTLSRSQEERSQAQQALELAKQQQDLNNYLLYILCEPASVANPAIRASAGVFLKNNLNQQNLIDPLLLKGVLKGLMDENQLVRRITGNVITSIFSIVGFENWSDLIPQLLELSFLGNEGPMGALTKICEDSCFKLDKVPSSPLSFLIPRLIELLGSNSANSSFIKSQAIVSINFFFKFMSQSLLVNLDAYLEKLFSLVNDPSTEVRKNLCSSFALILESRPDKLVPHLDGIINYALHCINDDNDEEVALEACEFLLGLSSTDLDQSIIVPKLELILTTLLNKMVYSEVDLFLLEEIDARDDSHEEDKDTDIKPTIVKSTTHTTKTKESNNKTSNDSNGNNDEEDEEDEEEDDEDEDGDLSEWNLRKCSAATLDVFASTIPEHVVPVVLPLLKPRILSGHWPTREAAILALGAIAEGCIELASDSLPELVPFLCDRLTDDALRVKQITCWTLSRYSAWICTQAYQGGEYKSYFEITFQNIMNCALDDKKIVQESACSSIANFTENCELELVSNLVEPILKFFNTCFAKYKRKNLIVLYDSVQTFVEKIGDSLSSRQDYITLLLPPLITKWRQLQDNDKDLWPLLECMSSVAASLGESFAPYAVDVYARAFKILSDCIEQDRLFQQQPTAIDTPEKDFIVTSVDLIDGLVQGLKVHAAELIIQHDQTAKFSLMQLLLTCFEDPVDDVRQSSFALLGDLSIQVANEVVKPYLHLIIITIGNEITNRNFNSSAVVNNAVWALGELALRLQHEDLQPYLNNLVHVLIPLLNSTDVQSTVLENAAITIGRLCCSSPLNFNEYLEEFLLNWCTHMLYLEENEEKETAFKGMCNCLTVKPLPLKNVTVKRSLGKFIECIVCYEYPGDELYAIFNDLLQGYLSLYGEHDFNNEVLVHLELHAREVLQMNYSI